MTKDTQRPLRTKAYTMLPLGNVRPLGVAQA